MVDKQAMAEVVGQNLKRLRLANGLSMQALANLAEIEKSQIVRIENGQVDARISSLVVLSHALNAEIVDFFKNVRS